MREPKITKERSLSYICLKELRRPTKIQDRYWILLPPLSLLMEAPKHLQTLDQNLKSQGLFLQTNPHSEPLFLPPLDHPKISSSWR